MIGIDKPSIEALDLSEDGTYGKFVMEPLERGYGTTIGNSLRRVLLSSLPGYAITSAKIDGVLHEFSTIPGVKEDVTEIVLNLKGVILKIHGDGPKTIYIEASGKCTVTAGDIKTDSDVEILNPDHLIATLSEGANLSMEMTCDRGRGYVSAERNKQMMKPVIGAIAIDSIYTPVLKVNYTVENTRVGQITDYDKLSLKFGLTVLFLQRKQFLSQLRFSMSISISLLSCRMKQAILRLWSLKTTTARKRLWR